MAHAGSRPRYSRRLAWGAPIALAALALATASARATLDVDDRGTLLRAGDYNLRVSNAGILGNPFPERSFDPSFEYPRGSGRELMHYASLWVGGVGADGIPRVSGAPLLEWRPTPAEWDTVCEAWHGQFGSRRGEDDDGDGRYDEELLNGRDDDGDGAVDEDLGLAGQQMTSADYVDDRPEAVNFVYPGYEHHAPLGLSVHQETYAWSWPGYRGIAGLQYVITNHVSTAIRDVYVGLYVDFDVRPSNDPSGSPDDDVTSASFSSSISKGTSVITRRGDVLVTPCISSVSRTLPVVYDHRVPGTAYVAVVPLWHTRDTLVLIDPGPERGPRGDTFHAAVFASDRSPLAGGTPRLDAERYAALAGSWNSSPEDHRGDQVVLIACGPFPLLEPGKSIRFSVALVAAASLDSLSVAMSRAVYLHEGTELNLIPDKGGPNPREWNKGETGINGHEVCVEPPPGTSFYADPDCVKKFETDEPIPPEPQLYTPGHCIWTDADCDPCTGLDGRETVVRWLDPYQVPPSPNVRLTPIDHAVRIEWDNLPEVLVGAGVAGPRTGSFVEYRVYRVSDWRGRSSLLPPDKHWELIGAYGPDTLDKRRMLASITDSTLDYTRIWYERPLYPIGRYRVVDTRVNDGFDYLYAVCAVVESPYVSNGYRFVARYESPLTASFNERVTPRAEARGDAANVWVVPNPYRGKAGWDRPPTYGDRLTTHLDFMGLPRARCTIRIWTVAGDLVATIEHDGTRGSGQASWDLVSRNGQDVVSGIYVFTVESPLGNATGRFVVIR